MNSSELYTEPNNRFSMSVSVALWFISNPAGSAAQSAKTIGA
jgi:hypothetical protein